MLQAHNVVPNPPVSNTKAIKFTIVCDISVNLSATKTSAGFIMFNFTFKGKIISILMSQFPPRSEMSDSGNGSNQDVRNVNSEGGGSNWHLLLDKDF
jgi:hypothetical protein